MMLFWLFSRFASTQADCDADKAKLLLGILPKWYKYMTYQPDSTGRCSIVLNDLRGQPQQLLLLVLALVEILLRVAGIVAVVFVLVGGFRYITSQGEPENTKAALGTIINALIGVAIAMLATAAVSFLGNRLGA